MVMENKHIGCSCGNCVTDSIPPSPDDDRPYNESYCPELYLVIRYVTTCENNIISEINKGRITITTINNIRTILDRLLTQIGPILYVIIKKQYTFGKTDAETFEYDTSNIDIPMREEVLVMELYNQLNDEVSISINKLYMYLYSLLYSVIRAENREVATNNIYKILIDKGFIAHTDAGGNDWQLISYNTMLLKTYARQSTNLGILFEDINHDLYIVSAHDTACPICIPFENRVFSRDGVSDEFPDIGILFGKKDESLPYSIENSWLNIHPNCLHFLKKFYIEDYSQDELQDIINHSSFKTNPIDRGNKFMQDMRAYRKRQYAKRIELNDAKQFRRYRLVLGDRIPKTLKKFREIKYNDEALYKELKTAYRKKVNNARET